VIATNRLVTRGGVPHPSRHRVCLRIVRSRRFIY
jgi:hypothetical protein